MGFNFDDAMDKRTRAAAKGIGSKEWVDFAHMMFDEFPALYDIAKKMTVHQDDLATERNELVTALQLVLECIDVPERNCSCHISPPCNDCVENGGLRNAVEDAKAAIAKATK